MKTASNSSPATNRAKNLQWTRLKTTRNLSGPIKIKCFSLIWADIPDCHQISQPLRANTNLTGGRNMLNETQDEDLPFLKIMRLALKSNQNL